MFHHIQDIASKVNEYSFHLFTSQKIHFTCVQRLVRGFMLPELKSEHKFGIQMYTKFVKSSIKNDPKVTRFCE